MRYPQKFEDLIESLESLPGIGAKTAERLAFFLIDKQNNNIAKKMSDCIKDAANSIAECEVCGMITDKAVCDICQDESRENKIMVVESSKDALAFEKTKAYKGKYHILNGTISPTNGAGPNDINIEKLISRINNRNVDEVIIATSSNIDGELTALYVQKLLQNHNIKTYRIGYGLPAGANIEYVDEITLIRSLESKKEM